MATVYLKDTTLTSIGNAIREKTGETAKLLPSEMANAIANIQTGGGSSGGLILPESGTQMLQLSGSSNETYISLGRSININKIKLIAFYTSAYQGYSGDYNTGFFYDPNICKHWVDGSGWHNLSLIAVGTATQSRYNYMGFSADFANGYAQKYNESTSYPMYYCYITCECDSNGIIGQLTCASVPSPVDDDYEFSNSEINFKSVLSKQGPFIILYDN